MTDMTAIKPVRVLPDQIDAVAVLTACSMIEHRVAIYLKALADRDGSPLYTGVVQDVLKDTAAIRDEVQAAIDGLTKREVDALKGAM